MAGNDKKDLHSHQLPDSDLDDAVGGAGTTTMYRAECTEYGCTWASDWTSLKVRAQRLKKEHSDTTGHNANIVSQNW